MKVLFVEAPGTPHGLTERIRLAVREFNRDLDIRLRFLSIGIDESLVAVADAAQACELVSASVRERAPDVVAVMGEGTAALAAATSAVRERAPLARIGAGAREGEGADASRAIDRLATLLLVHGPRAAAVLETEKVAAARVDVGPADDPSAADRIVRALARIRRLHGPGGSSSGGQAPC